MRAALSRFSHSANVIIPALFLAGFLVYPLGASDYGASNVAYLFVWVFLSLSLWITWGRTGILSFGQTAFFGVGGYLYGIIALNLNVAGLTPLALLVAVGVAGLFAMVVGYVMFYGGVSDVYVGITTLAITLGLETFLDQTAGAKWAIGRALLGGFNGMTGIPSLSIAGVDLTGRTLYYFLAIALAAAYGCMYWLAHSRYGCTLVAIRENRERTELLGYDVRRIQLQIFTLGGVLAGVSGVLYAAWGNYMTPSSLGVTAAVLPVIWVAAGGRKSLLASVVSTLVLVELSQALSVSYGQYALVALGGILVAIVLFAPDGALVLASTLVQRMFTARLHLRGITSETAPAASREMAPVAPVMALVGGEVDV